MNKTHMCPISGQKMDLFFTEKILGKYEVDYFINPDTGLIQTERPYWLDEAYNEAICDTDTGLVARNVSNANLVIPILEKLGLGDEKLLDIGGGYGLFARLLRDAGYDCYTSDKHCTNLFAKYFEPTDGFQAKALFAFEVLEHVPDPYELLNEAFQKYGCKTIIFSTEIFESGVPDRDWWYFAFETGQHITFYTVKSLEQLAERLGCKYYGINRDTHLITDISDAQVQAVFARNKKPGKARRLVNRMRGVREREQPARKSKTWDDHLLMKERLANQDESKLRGDKE